MPAIFGRIIARSFATVILIFAAVPANAQPLGQRAPMWDRALAEELLSYVNAAQADGLSPADYQPDRLTAAIAANDPAALDDAATRSFALLARDLINGHVRPEQRKGWFYASREPEQPRIEALMEGALASRRITGTLDRLLPEIGRAHV